MLLAVVLTAGRTGLVQFWLKIFISLYFIAPLATHLTLPTYVKIPRFDIILTTPFPDTLSTGMVTRPTGIETEHVRHEVTYAGAKSFRSTGVTSDIEDITLAFRFCLPRLTGNHIYTCIASWPIPVIIDGFFKQLPDLIRSVPRHLSPPSLTKRQ